MKDLFQICLLLGLIGIAVLLCLVTIPPENAMYVNSILIAIIALLKGDALFNVAKQPPTETTSTVTATSTTTPQEGVQP